jgi:cyclopropane-fatty-acyl-phospholipid synthase
MLKPGGYSTLQTMVKGNTPLDREMAHDMAWLYEEMFPETEIPRFCEVVEATEKLFEIQTIRNDRDHYARTCLAWRERLREARDAAMHVVGEAMVNKYDRYLELSARGFGNGTSNLIRIVMKRV